MGVDPVGKAAAEQTAKEILDVKGKNPPKTAEGNATNIQAILDAYDEAVARKGLDGDG